MASDLFDIGWWVMSADEDVYGPVSRATLRRYLEQGVISPHTLVRHSTQPKSQPVADVPKIRDGLVSQSPFLSHGDRLADVWPRRAKDRLALAEDSIPCAYRNRPAILVCLRCGAPYCGKNRMKPFNRQYYFCKRCQLRLYNRRSFAYLLDVLVFSILIGMVPSIVLGATGVLDAPTAGLAGYAFGLVGTLLFLFRDRLFGGAGPGKQTLGLKVVRADNGVTPLSTGQAFLRWVSHAIPVFNLFDLSAPYRDPLMRRYGDRWAGTRVIDSVRSLESARQRIRARLAKKGVALANPVEMPLSEFARFSE